MRKKIGKRIGPVPIALVAVFALAAFISAGLLLLVPTWWSTAQAPRGADPRYDPKSGDHRYETSAKVVTFSD